MPILDSHSIWSFTCGRSSVCNIWHIYVKRFYYDRHLPSWLQLESYRYSTWPGVAHVLGHKYMAVVQKRFRMYTVCRELLHKLNSKSTGTSVLVLSCCVFWHKDVSLDGVSSDDKITIVCYLKFFLWMWWLPTARFLCGLYDNSFT